MLFVVIVALVDADVVIVVAVVIVVVVTVVKAAGAVEICTRGEKRDLFKKKVKKK